MNDYERFMDHVREALDALAGLVEDPKLTYEPMRAELLTALGWLEMEATCGDCIEGRCHWGGAQSRVSAAAVKAGSEEYRHPQLGVCGCDRHEISVETRQRRVRLDSAAVV